MSATEILSYVIIFRDPHWIPVGSSLNITRLSRNISYERKVTNLETLSTNDADPSNQIQGLLYVPDLDPTDLCVGALSPYIPNNATRQANLPIQDFNLVALAPWISAECSQGLLDAANMDPIRAFIFYIPDNGTTQPPPISSPVWNMNDGGQWKYAHHFPVYAVPGRIGAEMMQEIAQYSSNLTSVPFGEQLADLKYDLRDYVRVYTLIYLQPSSSLPTLWVFLLIVAGVLATVIALTSLLMHFTQRRRRSSLRRRVAAGEVNLEALGIKRLTVPTELIEKIPLFIYTCAAEDAPRQQEPEPVAYDKRSIKQLATTSDLGAASLATPEIENEGAQGHLDESVFSQSYQPDAQPTCPICLEDFESGISTIRELNCGHIFHPGCIDNFLGNNSSLCPMCKKSALPLGFAPPITNGMVRRERMIRRLRERVIVQDDGQINTGQQHQDWRQIFHRQADSTLSDRSSDIELRRNFHDNRLHQTAHVRVQNILGDQVVPYEDEDAEDETRSKWRRIMTRVFPII